MIPKGVSKVHLYSSLGIARQSLMEMETWVRTRSPHFAAILIESSPTGRPNAFKVITGSCCDDEEVPNP